MKSVKPLMSRAIVTALASGLLAAAPSFAQVYKWVDEKGVVNYSNEAPANRKATQLDPKSTKVSIIGANESPKGATEATGVANERALSEKIDRLERKLDAERYARSASDAQVQTVADARYQQCVRDRRVDCDYLGMEPYYPYYDSYYPYYYGAAVYARPRVDHRHLMHRPGVAPKPVGRAAFAPGRAAAPRQM